jgi:hypothetical protein
MVTGNIPEQLRPDYDLPFSKVYQTYATHIIQSTGDLDIPLCGNNELENLPSWVPNLRYTMDYKFADTKHSASFSPDGKIFTVEGTRLELIFCVRRSGMDIDKFLTDVEETILTGAANIHQITLNDAF